MCIEVCGVYINLRQLSMQLCRNLATASHSCGNRTSCGLFHFCPVRFSAALSIFISEGEGKISLRRELAL